LGKSTCEFEAIIFAVFAACLRCFVAERSDTKPLPAQSSAVAEQFFYVVLCHIMSYVVNLSHPGDTHQRKKLKRHVDVASAQISTAIARLCYVSLFIPCHKSTKLHSIIANIVTRLLGIRMVELGCRHHASRQSGVSTM
jgi:hypothetical protein